MKIFLKVIITLFMIMGIIHIAFTPVFYTELKEETLWFIGTGLSLFFLGMLNIGAIYAKYKPLIRFAIFCNVIGLIFSIGIVFVLPVFQAYLVAVLALLMLIGSFWLNKNYDT